MSYLSNPGDNLTAQQQTILNTFIALATTPVGQHLAKDASGNFVNTPDTTGASSAGGSNTQLQYNNGGALGGITGMTYNGTKLNVLSSILEISDNTDTTKKVALALNTISTGTTITLTVPNQSGTVALLTDIPKITQVLDTNGNKILTFTTTASAVNYLDIKDNATGLAPTITAAGTDTNIDIEIVPKGSGSLKVSGSILVPSGLSNSSSRPAVSSARIDGEIAGTGSPITNDDGFLRLSAGGGTNPLVKSFIDISGYSTVPDMENNIVFGTSGVERLRIQGDGKIVTPNEISAKLQVPQGHMLNGKIVTSASAGVLTVEIKTLAGANPSTSDPVYIRIGNTIRTINSTFSYSTSGLSNYLNMGSTELGNEEVDLFVYLVWNSVANAVHMFASRIPYAKKVSDFVISTSDEKGVLLLGNPSWNGNDEVEVIGRFNVQQNPSGFALSIPATSVIINRPIFETRRLVYNAQWAASGTAPSLGNGTISSAYQLVMNRVNIYVKQNMGSTTTYGTGNYQWSIPFNYYAGVNLIQLQTGSGVYYNGSSYPIAPHNNYFFPGNGVSWTSPKDAITGGVCSGTNPATWNTGDYLGFGWQYDI